MIFDQFRISGDCGQRCLKLMRYIRRKILPHFCCHQNILMLRADRIDKRNQFLVCRSLRRILHIFCHKLNRLQKLSRQDMCKTHTYNNDQCQDCGDHWCCSQENIPDTSGLCCNTKYRSVVKKQRIIKCCHIHRIGIADTLTFSGLQSAPNLRTIAMILQFIRIRVIVIENGSIRINPCNSKIFFGNIKTFGRYSYIVKSTCLTKHLCLNL